MLPSFATIFAGLSVTAQTLFANSQPDIGLICTTGGRYISDADLKALHISLGCGRRSDSHRGLLLLRGLPDYFQSAAGIVAHKFSLPIDDHLRSVRAIALEPRGVTLLANGPFRGGVRIHPAIMIPIVDVFFESDDLNACNRLFPLDLAQKLVRWRTTRTAL